MERCRFRLGYVANALSIKNCTPSSTITFKNFSKISSEEIQLKKLKAVAKSNLEDTLRILKFNKYVITSYSIHYTKLYDEKTCNNAISSKNI